MTDKPLPDLTPLISPRTTAVVGASRNPAKLGHAVLMNMIRSGYRGGLYPVNPKEEEIEGLKCYPSIAALTQHLGTRRLDLAVLVIPSGAILAAAQECGQAGVRTLVVITAGFKEIGKEGLEQEKKLVEVCRQYSMRMVGPNCLGVMDTYTPMNASFAAGFPHKGEIAFISQSGALCASILDWSLSQGMGFSKFVSLGNKADLAEVDFIADAAQDPYSKVILAYVEDVRDGGHFFDVTREATRKKPVVILKSGLSQAGARAASSHTGALAGSDRAYDVAFRQAGVLRATTMEGFFDLASAFSHLPVPRGDRVVVVTNSGGPGILASDAVELSGLQMASLQRETVDALRQRLPAEANFYNPVDLIGDADAERYRFALHTVSQDPGIDSYLVMLTPTASTKPTDVARVVADFKQAHPEVPVVAVFMGGHSVEEGNRILLEAHVPSYFAPERAVTALLGVTRYGAHLRTPEAEAEVPLPDVDREAVAQVLDSVRADRRLVLLGSEASLILEAYGVATAPIRLARSPAEAARLATAMGYPVVLKIASPKIMHKTDIGGVRVGLQDSAQVEQAFVEILENVDKHLGTVPVHGVEVQRMMPRGRECIVGMSRDLQFGPLVMFGLGGIYVNLLKDVSFRLARGLTRAEIRAMIAETKAYTLLRGIRGEEPSDLEAVVQTIARVAQLCLDFPEIAELDVNPLFSYAAGVSALDVKITIS